MVQIPPIFKQFMFPKSKVQKIAHDAQGANPVALPKLTNMAINLSSGLFAMMVSNQATNLQFSRKKKTVTEEAILSSLESLGFQDIAKEVSKQLKHALLTKPQGQEQGKISFQEHQKRIMEEEDDSDGIDQFGEDNECLVNAFGDQGRRLKEDLEYNKFQLSNLKTTNGIQNGNSKMDIQGMKDNIQKENQQIIEIDKDNADDDDDD